MKIEVNKMVKMAVLSAMSIVLMLLIRFPVFPSVPYYEYEPADIPILIGAFLYGPLAAFIMTIIVAVIQFATVSSTSSWVGIIMHTIATGALVITAGIIYKYKKTRIGALIALIAGTLAMTLVMIPANLYFSVKFFGMTSEEVAAMIVPIIIPFNLTKAGVNSAITFIVYKHIGKILRKI